MKPFFTLADCDVDYPAGGFIQESRVWAITPEKANRLLEERGEVVMSEEKKEGYFQTWTQRETRHSAFKEKALLINIEPIEEPDSADKLIAEIANFRPGFSWVNIIERAKKLVGK